MYDVIVVGARCAGSPLAMLLARRGYDVLVVDRAGFPSDTVSTHYIQQTGLALLRDWGVLDAATAGCPPIEYQTISFEDLKLEGPAYEVDGMTAAYAPRRTVFDKALVDAARTAGAEVVEHFTVDELLSDGDRVIGVRGRHADGTAMDARARLVIGADGSNSTVAKLVGAEMYDHVPASCFIYYAYFSGLDWSFHHRTGYGEQQMGGWPTNDGQHLLAVMRKRDRYREFRAEPESAFHEIIDQVTPDLGEQVHDQAQRETPFQPMLYPDNYYRQATGPGWALVGDAGYHKDPYTGNGIADAIKHAKLLADAVHAGLSGERPLDEALQGYWTERDRSSRETYEFTCMISQLTIPQPIFDVFRATSADADYTRKFFGMMSGAITGAEFFAPENVERLYASTGFSPAS